MANMNFGVNLLPKQNNTYSLGNSDKKWNLYVNTINGETLDELIPEMVGATSGSNGSGGMVPAPTDGDTDKFLRGDGTWSEPNVNVWDEMTLNKTEATFPTNDVYVIGGETLITNNRVQYKVSNTPATGIIPKYDSNSYLQAETPPVGDNTNKVATTSFVANAVGSLGGIQINKTAMLPMTTIAIQDGYEIFPIQQMILGIEHTQDLHRYTQPWIGGSYINLVNVANYTVTEETTTTIGTFAADTYILSFNVNSTTESVSPLSQGGNAIIKADNTILDTLKINASGSERKIFSFTLESSATITLTIVGADTNYSYAISNIQVETSAEVSNYTPYENICPITAGYTQCNILHRGKNLWDNTSVVRLYGYYNNDGTFTEVEDWRPISISCKEDDVITIYGSHFKDIVTLWNGSTFVDYTTNTTITIPEGVNRIVICGLNTTPEDQVYCNEHTYEYEFPQEAGTVYGGQLVLMPDGTGTLTSNYNIKDLGSLTWTYDSTNDVFVADCFVDQKPAVNNIFKANAYCSNLPVIAASSVLAGNLGLGITSDGKYYVHYRGMGTDATAFTTAMTGQTIYYETATTSTYNMSSLEVITSFPGYNSFTCSTGKIRRIDYVANVTGLINTADKLKIDALDLDEQASINLSKADKVSGATNGNFAALNASGNLVDSGHKHSDYLTQHQDISGKANSADLAAVATSGDYDDLSNTPEEIDPYKVVSTPADVVTITDGADSLPVKQLKIAVEPVQDLHGYENPWPAGGGKNLLPMTVNAIKEYNTAGTWSGNAYTIYNVTFTIITDNDNNVIGIKVTGTASANIFFEVGRISHDNIVSSIINGCPSGGVAYSTYQLNTMDSYDGSTKAQDVGTGSNITPSDYTSNLRALIRIANGYACPSAGLLFKPMIRLSSASADFAPYSNICPISGWTGANVSRTGKNLCTSFENGTVSTETGEDSAYSESKRLRTGWIRVKENTQYTVSGTGNNITPQVYVVQMADNHVGTVIRADGWNGLPYTFLTDSDTKWVRLSIRGSGNPEITPASVSNAQLEESSDATAYEPFGTVYPITFPSSAGTVYGGTLTVNQDGTGTLTVDRASLVASDQYITYNSTSRWFTVNENIPNPPKASLNIQIQKGLCSDAFKAYSRDYLYDNLTIQYGIAVNTNGRIIIRNLDYTSVSDIVSYLNNHQIIYSLATPVTYSLTPGQVKTLLGVNNIWADTGKINRLEYPYETTGLIGTHDKVKLDLLPSSILSGINLASTALTPVNGIVTIPLMTGCDASNNGAAGVVPAPSSGDQNKFLAGDGTWKDGGKPMVILSYGNSTWNDFITAYNNNVIVYCRASSNSNPGSGSQTRMAFMAYVNNADTPTNVEFQYYRSVNAHSATQMGDQVFIYKLDKNSGWSVTTREASIKEINVASGSKLGVSWSSNKVTLSNTMTADDMPMSSSDATTTKSAIDGLNSKLTKTIYFNKTCTSGEITIDKNDIPGIPLFAIVNGGWTVNITKSHLGDAPWIFGIYTMNGNTISRPTDGERNLTVYYTPN